MWFPVIWTMRMQCEKSSEWKRQAVTEHRVRKQRSDWLILSKPLCLFDRNVLQCRLLHRETCGGGCRDARTIEHWLRVTWVQVMRIQIQECQPTFLHLARPTQSVIGCFNALPVVTFEYLHYSSPLLLFRLLFFLLVVLLLLFLLNSCQLLFLASWSTPCRWSFTWATVALMRILCSGGFIICNEM